MAVRSALVTLSGGVVALTLWVLAVSLFLMVGESPVSFLVGLLHAAGDFSFATYVLAVLVLGTAAGLTTLRRWPDWRFYAGTLGWLCIVVSYWVVTLSLKDGAEPTTGRHPATGLIVIAAALALVGIGLLVAKRGKPPAKPFGLVTPLAIVVAAVGIPTLAYAVLMHGIIFVALDPIYTLPLLVLGTAAGFATMRRRPGWRFYAGTFGWLYIVFSYLLVTLLLAAEATSGRHPSNGLIAIAAALALVGIGILVAKRGEPPAKPFGLVTPLGVVMAVAGILALIYAVIMHHIIILAIEVGVVGVVLMFGGAALALHWRGWRIVAGGLGWLLIAGGVVGGWSQASLPHDAKSFFGLWATLQYPMLSVALGYFILWAKRHEPNRVSDATPAAHAAYSES